MKELLLAIRNALRKSSVTNYIKDENILVTEQEGYIPNSCKFPLITIKDNGANNDEQICNRYLQEARVYLTIFNRLYKIEQSILDNRSILDIEEDIIRILINNRLDNDSITGAFPITQEATRNIVKDNDIISYKRIVMSYKLYKKWD